jgi:hypothetical protein
MVAGMGVCCREDAAFFSAYDAALLIRLRLATLVDNSSFHFPFGVSMSDDTTSALRLVTPPASEPLTLDHAKAFLRVEHTADDDAITRTQRSNNSAVVGTDAWVVTAGTSNRQLLLSVEALATDDAFAVRLRSLALTGVAGNFQLEMNASETVSFSAFVTQYRETIEAGAVKRCAMKLESSGAVVIG